MLITRSVRFAPGDYELAAKDAIRTPVITVRGSGITVDFGGATLRGSAQDTPPDKREGLAVLVDGGENVTLKNLHIHGYRLAILARNTRGLRISNCDWSYNWEQHLNSTPEKEDESDWMYFQHNDRDEWIYGEIPYGAGGVYLSNCDDFQVDHCQNAGSQCGLMLNRCSKGKVFANAFSFLSAIGIGLYRSSGNEIMQNNLDYCVRGYSHGTYARGQDSAAILVYEQSDRNVFAYNSGTHGGDGFFLWAGQTTMDTGKGGCNDNFVYGNDFSHAVANGIEATFSRNTFVDNRLVECWHGVWGGYSFDSKFIGNEFAFDGQAIAIEHGQDNEIEGNDFTSCDDGIVLWAKNNVDPSWGYGKVRDIASHGYVIDNNHFNEDTKPDLSIDETTDVRIGGNSFLDSFRVFDSDTEHFDFAGNKIGSNSLTGLSPAEIERNTRVPMPKYEAPGHHWMREDGSNLLEWDPAIAKGAFDSLPMRLDDNGWHLTLNPGGAKTVDYHVKPLSQESIKKVFQMLPDLGRRFIEIGEWGPHDFRPPGTSMANARIDVGETSAPRVLGPEGRWKILETPLRWIRPTSRRVGDILTANMDEVYPKDIQSTLRFHGSRAVSPPGADRPVTFIHSPKISGR